MKGVWPSAYHDDPNPPKSLEEIWQDLDGYSFEELFELPAYHQSVQFVVPIPPLYYQEKFIKGFCFSQVVRLLLEKVPELKKLFFVCANSMTFSYPWAHKADCFFTCYKYPEREAYFKNKYPETKDIVCLPLQDADYTNEEVMKPLEPKQPKTVDLFCISSAFPVKNLTLIAESLKVYEKKYNYRLKVVCALGSNEVKKNKDGSIDYSDLGDYSKNELIKVDKILGNTKDYVDFIPYITYWDLPKYFSMSKCGVLASLIEGKCRFLYEALSSDMPMIVFKQYNQFSRGGYPIFFGQNSGEYAPLFTAESLADTIHKVLLNLYTYTPRKNYLQYRGRKNFIKTVATEIPYYRENIPNFNDGNLFENQWINEACMDNYGVLYQDFLYDKLCNWSNVASLEATLELVNSYLKKFCIKKKRTLLRNLLAKKTP